MQSTSARGIFKLTPEEAFTQGTALHTAIRYEPEQTRTELVRLIQGTVEFIDAKKTLDVEGVLFTAEAIVENNPTTTLEELRLVCDGMKTGKFGKFYERLKTQEFISCLNKHEAGRAEFLERRAQAHKIERGASDPTRSNFQPQSMADLRRKQAAPIFAAAAGLALARRAEAEQEQNKQEQNKQQTDGTSNP